MVRAEDSCRMESLKAVMCWSKMPVQRNFLSARPGFFPLVVCPAQPGNHRLETAAWTSPPGNHWYCDGQRAQRRQRAQHQRTGQRAKASWADGREAQGCYITSVYIQPIFFINWLASSRLRNTVTVLSCRLYDEMLPRAIAFCAGAHRAWKIFILSSREIVI